MSQDYESEAEYYYRTHPAETQEAQSRATTNADNASEREEAEYYEKTRDLKRPLAWRAADIVSNSRPVKAAQKISESVTESRVGRAASSALETGRSTYDFFMGPPPNRERASMHQDNIAYLRRPAVKTRGPPPAIRGIDFREPQGISIAPEPRYLFGGGGYIGGGMPRAQRKPKKKTLQQRNNQRDSLF